VRSSELIALLESEDEIGALRQAIAADMPAYRRGHEVGGSSPIHVSWGERSVQITLRHVGQICKEFLAGRLDRLEMTYLMTALELCPDFEIASEELADIIGGLADVLIDEADVRRQAEEVLRSI
jgi:hypothetical protein